MNLLEAFGHFGFEFGCAVIGGALLAAGVGALIAKPSYIAEKIPLIGDIIAGARVGIGVVLVGGGCLCLGAGAGYFHRGTLDQSASLEEELKAERKLKSIAEARSKSFAEAREKAEKDASEIAERMKALSEQARIDDEKSSTHDGDSCLAPDGVQRLNSIRRRKARH
jgi:hypothetical protein